MKSEKKVNGEEKEKSKNKMRIREAKQERENDGLEMVRIKNGTKG
jgi:hypothetical protein